MTIPHSTDLYAPAGRGILYIAKWNGTVPPIYPGAVATYYPNAADIAAGLGDFEDIGNAPTLEVEPTVEKRPHYSSRAGLKTKDLNPIVSLEYSINFDVDELAAGNMKRFLMGTYTAASGMINALTDANAEYAIIFVSDNPLGPNYIKYFRRVTLGPNGPLQLIGDDYLVMSFAGEGLSDVATFPASPYFDVKMITTTTTSTTTTTTA
jgi:hypothetical protein